MDKKTLGAKRPLGANSRNSRAFSEQLSELHSQPKSHEYPILGAILGATPGIGWTPKFQPRSSECSFEIGLDPARQRLNTSGTVCFCSHRTARQTFQWRDLIIQAKNWNRSSRSRPRLLPKPNRAEPCPNRKSSPADGVGPALLFLPVW